MAELDTPITLTLEGISLKSALKIYSIRCS